MERVLQDEELAIVSGGVLRDGWEDVLLKMMQIYKIKFNEKGKQMVKDTMVLGVKDTTSTIDENDIVRINQFIDENWDNL
ncbi:MAG: hypothetical protein J6D29_05825 [Solobacterium sp.]|nr:hypothetical protein [Solobacterium sp.]